MNRIAPQDFRQTCYAAMASDELRAASSSGGAFTILAREVLARVKAQLRRNTYVEKESAGQESCTLSKTTILCPTL